MRYSYIHVLFLAAIGVAVAQEPTTEALRYQPTDANETRIERLVEQVDAEGNLVNTTENWVQLQDGLNYWEEKSGQWEPAREEIEIVGQGAVARRLQHQVIFSSNVNDPAGAIDVLVLGSVRLRSSLLALRYFDAATGKDAIIATVRDAQGELLPPNQVIYRNAFDGVSADVVYTAKRQSFEADVVLREVPKPPTDFGLNPETTRLEVVTEFFDPPRPEKRENVLSSVEDPAVRAQVAEPDWIDEELDFGANRLGRGRAFAWSARDAATESPENFPLVSKRWVSLPDGRIVLIESVDYLSLLDDLSALPGQANLKGLKDRAKTWAAQGISQRRQEGMKAWAALAQAAGGKPLGLPRRRVGLPDGRYPEVLLAKRDEPARPGLVLDWISVVGGSANYTFKGDETYHVTGYCNFTGTTTLEGGAVLKFPRHAASGNTSVNVLGSFVCQTKPYLQAVFTAEDDNTIGATVIAGTPTLSDYYALSALRFVNTGVAVSVENIRVRYAGHGVYFEGNNPSNVVRHSQFVNCYFVLSTDTNKPIWGRNLLVDTLNPSVGCAFVGTASAAAPFVIEHATVYNAPLLYGGGSCTLVATNCMFISVTNLNGYSGAGNYSTIGNSGLFQPVGAGSFYLASGSPHRNAGVTNIDTTLAKDLADKTTYAPVVLNSDFTNSTTLATAVGRDTDTPDRGYHYPALDYCLSNLAVTNATLSLTNGVGLGLYGVVGLRLQQYGVLQSEGTPTQMNHVLRHTAVQEQASNWGSTGSTFDMIKPAAPNATGSAMPSLNVRFTEFLHPAVVSTNGVARMLLTSVGTNLMGSVTMRDCYVSGLKIDFEPSTLADQNVALFNNVFERGAVAIGDDASGAKINASLYNNLLLNTYDWFVNKDANSWVLKDNLFASATLTTSNGLTASNNGFKSGLTAFGTTNKTGLSLDFVAGTLGRFCYPTSGGATSLFSLVNTGSRAADVAGLYHYTTRVDNAKETTSTVDIGFHYIALNGSGQPNDADGDGVPDYIEDSNGNGTLNSGEGIWQLSGGPGGGSGAGDFGFDLFITRPRPPGIVP